MCGLAPLGPLSDTRVPQGLHCLCLCLVDISNTGARSLKAPSGYTSNSCLQCSSICQAPVSTFQLLWCLPVEI